MDLRIPRLKQAYINGEITPRQVVQHLIRRAGANNSNPGWTYLLSDSELESYLHRLEKSEMQSLPLYGVPFAIKDNIDLAGVPTTAACPAFSYVPEKSATVVQRLIDAGAVPLGKTNMDQFATGLVGVRSPEPWGPCHNVFDEAIISGGSSSGSAVVLAQGQVSFSLGTDTAGSGRVPAALNNLVGLKPSRGLLSCNGVVPACKSLDCVSIFAFDTDDANTVFDIAVTFDKDDAFSRENPYANSSRYYKSKKHFTFAVPKSEQLAWFGSEESVALFTSAVANLQAAGGEKQEFDFEPFVEAAKLLYEGPWVAERFLATKGIIEKQPEAMLPVIRDIIGAGNTARATDAFSAQYKLASLRQRAEFELAKVDVLVTPTIPRYYSIEEVQNNPLQLNSNLGYYTNYMNLLDCCAVAVPTGFYKNGVGFGITLVQRAFADKQLLSIAATLQNQLKLSPGNCQLEFKPVGASTVGEANNTVDVLVCGAHLDGLPLNWQLRERGATLLALTQTSAQYRFFALPGGPPLRPALVRVNAGGVAIEVEVWRMPSENFGSFVAEIPAPLGVGKVELENGEWVTGFICDHWGLTGAEDISHHRAWRRYLEAR